MFGVRHRFRVCTGARYLRGYIGDEKSKHNRLRDSTMTWERNINMIRKTAGKYPQESYSAVVCAIQSEWIFIQCLTWYTGNLFAGVEKMIRETFLPRLFFGKNKNPLPRRRRSEYNTGQECCYGAPEYSDVSS